MSCIGTPGIQSPKALAPEKVKKLIETFRTRHRLNSAIQINFGPRDFPEFHLRQDRKNCGDGDSSAVSFFSFFVDLFIVHRGC